MKKLGLSTLMIGLLILGGCSEALKISDSIDGGSQEESPVIEQEVVSGVKDSVVDEEAETIDTETSLESSNNETDNNQEEPSEIEKEAVNEAPPIIGGDPSINSAAYKDSLFYEHGDRIKLESANYLTFGDEVELRDNEEVYAKVKLNKFKIVDSTDGAKRKAIAFFYTVTNTSSNEIESGAYPFAKNPTFVPEVVYGTMGLKLLKSTTPTFKIDGEDYINTKHVQFSEEDANMPACTQITTLKPGESLDCYAHYSFPGVGNYLVGQIAESEFREWRTYSIEVTQEDMNIK